VKLQQNASAEMERMRLRITRVELIIRPFAVVLTTFVYRMQYVNGLMGLSGLEHAQVMTVSFFEQHKDGVRKLSSLNLMLI
jgi:hypothetical protein